MRMDGEEQRAPLTNHAAHSFACFSFCQSLSSSKLRSCDAAPASLGLSLRMHTETNGTSVERRQQNASDKKGSGRGLRASERPCSEDVLDSTTPSEKTALLSQCE